MFKALFDEGDFTMADVEKPGSDSIVGNMIATWMEKVGSPQEPVTVERRVQEDGTASLLVVTRRNGGAVRTWLDHKTFEQHEVLQFRNCLLYTSPSPRDRTRSRMPSSA